MAEASARCFTRASLCKYTYFLFMEIRYWGTHDDCHYDHSSGIDIILYIMCSGCFESCDCPGGCCSCAAGGDYDMHAGRVGNLVQNQIHQDFNEIRDGVDRVMPRC